MVVLGYVVHCLAPTFQGPSRGFLGIVAAAAMLRAEVLKLEALKT